MKILTGLLLSVAGLSTAGTITFSEVSLPNLTSVTNQYTAFGIQTSHTYFYVDGRDTFDQMGLSIESSSPGVILFTPDLAATLSIDYWVIGGNTGTYSVFDGSHTLLDTFTVDALGGDVLGSHTFAASNIAELDLIGVPGDTQVSTLRFNGGESVSPEPATWGLMLAGLAGVAVRRLRHAHS